MPGLTSRFLLPPFVFSHCLCCAAGACHALTRRDCVSVLSWQGIDAFFRNHTCNEWCERLDIEYERPQFSSWGIDTVKSTSYRSLLY